MKSSFWVHVFVRICLVPFPRYHHSYSGRLSFSAKTSVCSEHCRNGFCVKFGSRRTNQSAEKRTNQATGTKLVVNASSLLLATARPRCVFVHVALSVRLPSPRALRRNDYIYRASLCDEVGGRFWFSIAVICRHSAEVKPVSVQHQRTEQTLRVINPTIGCHYFPSGLQLPSQPLKGHFTLWKKPLYRRLIVFTTTF